MLSAVEVYAQIVLTEVMFDPIVEDDYYEFIEIWNSSDSYVNLYNWRIGDRFDDDEIIGTGEGLIIAPRQFGLILDSDYFDNYEIYSNIINENCLLLTINGSTLGDLGLKNSEPEKIIIRNNNNVIISEYTYSIGNTSGFSDEKITLDGLNSSENWADCLELNGTPGGKNSVTPDSVNLALISITASYNNNEPEEYTELTTIISNTGIESILAYEIAFFLDADADSAYSEGEIFEIFTGDIINSGDTVEIAVQTYPLVSGVYIFGAANLIEDDDSSDDLVFTSLTVGMSARTLIFNEILYNPSSGLGEWVEIYNRSGAAINLSGCYFSDSHVLEMTPVGSMTLFPGEYLVIAEESSVFTDYDIPFEAEFAVPIDFPALNNDGDTLYIFDASGEIIDMIAYPDDWGNIDNGVSMERINPESSSSGISGWMPCVDAIGSTPGAQNSVYFTSSMNNGVKLSADPKSFFPEEPGMANTTAIIVDLPYPSARVNIRIFDVKGRLIRFLAKAQMAGPHSEYEWDGKKDNGEYANIGMYIIHLEAVSETFVGKFEAKYVVILGRKL